MKGKDIKGEKTNNRERNIKRKITDERKLKKVQKKKKRKN